MAAVFVAVAAPSASADRLIVDDAVKQCPNATFTTLRGAIDAANLDSDADTVIVCPGLFTDPASIPITQPLTVQGAGADLVRIEPSAGFSDYVLRATDAGIVDISGVTIAAGDPQATSPRNFAVSGAVAFGNTDGELRASRLTDLTDGTPGTGTGVLGTGSGPVDVVGSLIEAYGPAGARFETDGAVRDSVIRGRGPVGSVIEFHDGVEVVGPTTEVEVVRNLIADNRNTADEAGGAGIRLIDGGDGTKVNQNDLQGNEYGVFRGDTTGRCDDDPAIPEVDATNNWWGNLAGPTFAPKPTLGGGCASGPPPGPPTLGDRVNSGVNYASHSTVPNGAPVAPAPQPDNPPVITGLTPADNTEAEPGSAVNVKAEVSDDFDVKRVQFRRGTAAPVDDTVPPYTQPIEAPAAGQSTAVTITAFDSADQTRAAAISLRGKVPPPADPPPAQPQQQAEPEDRPPGVAITGPGEGAAINPTAPPRLTADASDDRGVARVAFLDDGKVVCTDDSAPYDCAYAPTGDDVGRNTLIAIAVDGAGQTAVAFRGVSVGRFDPKLTASTTPKRDRKRPYRYTTTGSVVLPAGVTPEQACATGGSVSVEFRAGKLRLPQSATLRPDCTFRTSIAFPSRRPLGSGRLAVSAKFGGNSVLGTAKAPTQKVRAG